MFFSRVELNPQRRGSRHLLVSPQAMHAAVLCSFPGVLSDRTDARVLWRTDAMPGAVRLYVVSPEQPDFAHLIEQAGWPTLQTWETRDYTGLLDKLAAGQLWGFRLAANPTHAVPRGDRTGPSKRFGHVTVEQQERWLLDRAEGAGFAIEKTAQGAAALSVHDRRNVQFERKRHRVTLSQAVFDGVLRVLDEGALRKTLVSGLGPAKAYGCGLLTLAPTG